jgi:hypothetical protein
VLQGGPLLAQRKTSLLYLHNSAFFSLLCLRHPFPAWRLQHVLEKLPAELKAQQKNHATVAARLKAQSNTWLRNTPGLRHFADTFVLHWCDARNSALHSMTSDCL